METPNTTEPTQYPAFWDEEWLRSAIDRLDLRKMTPEERANYARVTAANAEAVEVEKRRIEEAKRAENVAVKTELVTKALKRGKLTVEEIAEDSSVPVDFVLEIQRQRADGQ